MVSVPGIGSGLDVDGIVSQLVAVEIQPKSARLDQREGKLQAQLSAIGALKGALDKLRGSVTAAGNEQAFGANRVSVPSDDLFTASVDGDARIGSYSVEVMQRATAQSLASTAFASAADTVGQGTLTISRGTIDPDTGSFTVDPTRSPASITIDASNNTLSGIRDALNQAEIGLNANIINDGSGDRLVLASTQSGVANAMQISVADADGNNTDSSGLSVLAFDSAAAEGNGQNLIETRGALDAILRVDGLQVTRPDNTISDVLEGVTLDLKKAAPGEWTTLTVEPDYSPARTAIEGFVESYNDLWGLVKELSAVDLETGSKGPMVGDATLRTLTSRLRSAMTVQLGAEGGQTLSLTEIGISTQRDGTLKLDAGALDAALENDRAGVASIFASLNTATDPLIDVVEFPPGVEAGDYAIEITQVATSGSLLGAAVRNLRVNARSDELRVAIDGVQSGDILLTRRNYADGDALAAEIQTKINLDSALAAAGAGVTVSFDSDTGALRIESNSVGSESRVEILSVDTNTTARLGLSPGLGTDGMDVAGTIGGIAATGNGRELSGTGILEGVSILVSGGAPGPRGSISISSGLGGRIDDIIASMLDQDGALQARTDGIDDRLDRIGADRARLDVRAEALQERLLAQYRALDSLMSQMSATSAFLTQQLAGLPTNNT